MNRPADVRVDGGFGPFLRSHLSSSAFWTPVRMADSAWHEHVPFAFWLVEALRPNTFVELGTHNGVSYCAVCQAVERLILPTRCFAVDTWKGDEHSGFYDEAVFRDLSQHHDQRYGRFSRLIRTTFDTAAENFSEGSVDLLHIDGLHTYDAVSHDFETWLPKLSSRAVVVFHDTNVRERGFEVWKFWQLVSRKHPSFEFAHGHGLGVLGVGADQSRRMSALFAISDDQTQYVQVCDVFAALGGKLKRDHCSHKLREDLYRHADLFRTERAHTASLEQEMEDLVARNNGLMVSQFQHKARADSVMDQLRDAEKMQRRADTRHKADVTRLANLKNELKALREDRDQLVSANEELGRQAEEVNENCSDLEAELARRLVELGQHRAELDQQQAELDRQQTVAVQQENKLAGLAGLEDQLRRAEKRAEDLDLELSQSKTELDAAQEWRRTAESSALWRLARGLKKPQSTSTVGGEGGLFNAARSIGRRRKDRLDRKLVRSSGLFDPQYYLSTYADVARAGMDPLVHFCKYGWREGRRPGDKFDTKGYLRAYPDVASAEMNPLVHFLRFGKNEGRSPEPSMARSASSLQRHGGTGGAIIQAGSSPAAMNLYGPLIDPQWHRTTEVLAALAGHEGLIDGDVPEEILEIARQAVRTRPHMVSVVMPTWNREASICDAVQSALQQSYLPFEIIISDDGSTDKTIDVVAERFAAEVDSGIVKILKNPHRGVSAARNAGLAAARGELVAYLDSDNIWRRDMLLLATSALSQNDELACVYTALQSHNQDSGAMRVRASHYERRRLLESNFIDLNVFVHRRALYDQYGGFDESLNRLVDWELIIRYTRNHTPAFIPYMGVDYFLNSKRLQNITSVVPLDENRSRIHRKHFVERARLGLDTLRLAYVLWDFPALSQTFVTNELRWLVRSGYDVKVYYAVDPDKAAELDFDIDAQKVRNAEDLAKRLVEHDRNICHSHFVYPVVTRLVHPACIEAGIYFTFMPHAVDIFHHRNVDRNRIDEIVSDPLCLRIWVYGDYHRRFLEKKGVPRNKFAYTFQAIEASSIGSAAKYQNSTQGSARARGIVIARFIEKKGISYLIDAVARLDGKAFDIEVYGYGPLVDEYRSRIAALELENVKIKGPITERSDLYHIYAEADFLVVPSVVAENGDVEGFPTVILEAIAANVPVISTTVSAIPDYLTDGINAILVEPASAVALAAGMQTSYLNVSEPATSSCHSCSHNVNAPGRRRPDHAAAYRSLARIQRRHLSGHIQPARKIRRSGGDVRNRPAYIGAHHDTLHADHSRQRQRRRVLVFAGEARQWPDQCQNWCASGKTFSAVQRRT